MSVHPAWRQTFDFFGPPVVVESSRAALSSDAGLLPLRQFDERLAFTQAFAAALQDRRDPDLTEHSFLEMVRSRVYGTLAAYEDKNDHDTLRTDPIFKLLLADTKSVAKRGPVPETVAGPRFLLSY